jgi:hypothetical protein
MALSSGPHLHVQLRKRRIESVGKRHSSGLSMLDSWLMRMRSSWKRETMVPALMPLALRNETSTALDLGLVAPSLAAQARASQCTRKASSHVSMISSHVCKMSDRFLFSSFGPLHCSKLVKVSSAQEYDSEHYLTAAKTNICRLRARTRRSHSSSSMARCAAILYIGAGFFAFFAAGAGGGASTPSMPS